jgi:hypothetical protein
MEPKKDNDRLKDPLHKDSLNEFSTTNSAFWP